MYDSKKKKTAYDLYLEHHGIKGQKWGVRRYQNTDGTLTSAGRQRYGMSQSKSSTDEPSVESKSGTYSDGSKWESTTIRSKDSQQKFEKGDKAMRMDDEDWENLKKSYKDIKEHERYDYDKAIEFDYIGMEALERYVNKGKEAAVDYVKNELKDYSYEMVLKMEEEIWEGESFAYPLFGLKINGTEYSYNTAGESDYSDDQYFSKRNR